MEVNDWFAKRTFHYSTFADLEHLCQLKERAGTTVSLIIPTYNEKETVVAILHQIRRSLIEEYPLLDELVVIDGHSTDGTVEAVRGMGVRLYFEDEVLAGELPPATGKGEALWKSLYVTGGDIVAWIDADIRNFAPHFVYGIIAPLLEDQDLVFVKAFYERPLRIEGALTRTGGGRVTELMAKPLINFFEPRLAGFIQPLSGEYAGRRELMESIPFYTGYGVEIGLMFDILDRSGLEGMAQVDLESKVHYNQDLSSLKRMSFGILQTVFIHLREKGCRELPRGSRILHTPQIGKSSGVIGYEFASDEVSIHKRPPMQTIKRDSN